MLVSSYINQAFDDVLIVQLKNLAPEEQDFEKKGDITRLVSKDSDETVGFNFFNVSKWLKLEEDGPITLTEEQVDSLNEALKVTGFQPELVADTSPKFVVGYVQECVPHEDSDHLSVTKTEVDNGEVLQIVCGAANIAAGQKVVVAKPGSVMPNGLVIWPGELRGVTSNGMICSARELGIEEPENATKGILVLDDEAEVGSEFNFKKL